MKVEDIMNSNISVLEETISFDYLFKKFFENEVLPHLKVNEQSKIRGILTIFDIARYLYLYSTIVDM
jgi:CBS domain-containing protein